MPRNDERRAEVVALGGVVVDDVEDHLDARRVQRAHHALELLHLLAALAGRRVARSAARRSRSCCSPSSCDSPFSCSVESLTNWCTGISSIAVTPSFLQVVDDRGVRDAARRCRACSSGMSGMQLGQALHVRLVDERSRSTGVFGVPVAGPVEERVDDDAVHHRARRSRRRCASRGRRSRSRTATGPTSTWPSIAFAYGSSSSLFGLKRWPVAGSYGAVHAVAVALARAAPAGR